MLLSSAQLDVLVGKVVMVVVVVKIKEDLLVKMVSAVGTARPSVSG